MAFLEKKELVQEKKIVQDVSILFITIQKQEGYSLKNKKTYLWLYLIYQVEIIVDGSGERILQKQDCIDCMLVSLEQFM